MVRFFRKMRNALRKNWGIPYVCLSCGKSPKFAAIGIMPKDNAGDPAMDLKFSCACSSAMIRKSIPICVQCAYREAVKYWNFCVSGER